MAESDRFDPNRFGDGELPALIACGGMVLRAYDLNELLYDATKENVRLLNEDDPYSFAPEVKNVKLLAGPAQTLKGNTGIDFTGTITIDGGVSDKKINSMFGQDNAYSFLRTSQANRSINLERLRDYPAVRMEHALGMAVLMFVPKSRDSVILTNNMKDPYGDKMYKPLELDAMEKRAQFTAFANCFYHTVDYVVGMYQKGDPTTTCITGWTNIKRKAKTVAGDSADKATSTETAAEDMPEDERLNEPISGLKLDDIGGLESQRETLKQIALSYNHPDVMEKWGAKRPGGIMLHGPAGTGKTMLVHALANEIGAEIEEIQSSDIYHKWVGDSEARIKEIFTQARRHEGRLILFFDEIDAIIGITDGDSGGGAVRNNVAGLFKQEMNSLYVDNPDVLIAAATNDLDRIDPTIRRSGRFDYVLQVPLPNEAARIQIIANKMDAAMRANERDDFRMYADDVNVPRFAELMDGYSGADIAEILRRLSFAKALEEARTGNATPITQADIEQAIIRFKQD